ncbi:MAG: DUF1549 domain-containing protein, partial [bacterium]|nr:DUF1549 domain-containing protein [bacterium]
MSTRDTILSLTLVIVASTMSLAEDQNDPTKPVDKRHAEKMAAGLALFKSEVRPVLMSQCLRCHGGEDTEADFDLSTRELLLKGGETGKAVLAGDAKSSRLMKLIKHEVEPEMPVDASKLKAEQIAAIAKWIDLSAPYDAPLTKEGADETPWTERVVTAEAKQYWAFQPLGEFAPPVVQNRDWGKTEVDSFVLNRLESLGIKPNQVADKRVLIRRVYLDLLGMPPTTEEVKAFVANNDPDAYSKLIDRLLKSPHYGERWGRHWLDLARFAESHGFEQDYDRPHAFHYRDFVIKALNADMPYDQFVRWQLAGDELAPTEPLAMAATGFLGAGVFPTQLTEKEFEPARYDELADMTGTMGVAMLGMTIGCARCHDHKFDPIPQADFYRIASSFTTTVRSEIDLKTKPVGLDKYLVQHQVLVDALKQYEQQELVKKTRQWVA